MPRPRPRSWLTGALRRSLTDAAQLPRALVGTLALIIGVAACGPANSPAIPTATQSEAVPTPDAEAECGFIDLRDPDGAQIDLTGTWRHAQGGPVYYLYQDGTCVWYAGGFAASGGDQTWGPLGLFTVVFEGTVAADFTISGRWASVRRADQSLVPHAWRNKIWTIKFEPTASGYDVVLTSPPAEDAVFGVTRLEKLSDEIIEP